MGRHYFHLHLISDATGETLIAASRAAAAQYEGVASIEHVYPLVRSRPQLVRAIAEIEASPGIVLFTLVDQELASHLESSCKELSVPCLSVLQPILNLFQSYIGTASLHRPGAQHILNAEYFRRIEALNFTMMHDDGQQTENFEEADVVLLGVSRTSKTPTSIYLANRGIKTANIPVVPDIPLPEAVLGLRGPLVVGLIASVDRIVQIRENRLLALNASPDSPYVDRILVAAEVSRARRLCADHGWPIIDVTHRSIEETAAAVLDFYKIHQLKFIASS
ncbi:MAG: kinase/pyrophosphorylase [Beijerinckiaceae bacterium]|nr:kinase/pyrophosphorylase [Beijerinckiaceae bacterium]